MHILISNDDGYLAEGLSVLEESLASIANVSVVVPDRNRSAASNSLTLEVPLRIVTGHNGYVRVDGTPTDCVHLAITGLLKSEPDMVIAGINHGANLGDDVIYSGTVAAATEGRFLGLPAIAISITSSNPDNLETAGHVALTLVRRIRANPLPKDTLLNVNVPDIPLSQIKGYRVTRLGQRHKAEPVIESVDPRGKAIFWVGPPGAEQDAGLGTDFDAVKTGYVSITPLQLDLTRYDRMLALTDWLSSEAGDNAS